MRVLLNTLAIFLILHQTQGYSKYGRTCKDIGCPSNEVCVIAEDPCSYYSRDQCGTYPTCKPVGNAAPSCATFTCPPTQICQMDKGTPKCVSEKTSSSTVHKTQNSGAQQPSYPAQNPSYPAQNPSYPAQNPSYPPQNPSYPPNPSAPNYPSGGLYPSLSTTRPPYGGSYPSQPGGYPSQSGGYPSQSGGYPSQSGGYPSYPAYPSNPGYPQQGYNRGGYPAYPSQGGYPNQGYPQYGYNGQGYAQRPGSSSNSGSNPILDKITDQLKTIGAGILKNALSNALSGNKQQQQH